jgi:folate-dependent phosphoribosylglycinamide formyltransferase PurN
MGFTMAQSPLLNPMQSGGAAGVNMQNLGAGVMQLMQQAAQARVAHGLANQKLVQAIQASKQAGIKTNFMPAQQQSQIFAKEAPVEAQLAQHIIYNPTYANDIQSLMTSKDPFSAAFAQNMLNNIQKSGVPGGGIPAMGGQNNQPVSYPGSAPTMQNGGTQVGTNQQIVQHMRAQMAGQTHPGVGHQQSAQAGALQNLIPMLPGLAQSAQQYGGPMGWLQSHVEGNPAALAYNEKENAAIQLARQAGIPGDFLTRTISGKNTGSTIDQMIPQLKKMLESRQNIARKSATGQLLNPAQNPSAPIPTNNAVPQNSGVPSYIPGSDASALQGAYDNARKEYMSNKGNKIPWLKLTPSQRAQYAHNLYMKGLT